MTWWMQLSKGTRRWYHPLTRSILLAWKLKSDVHKLKRSFKKSKSTTSSLEKVSRPKSTTSRKYGPNHIWIDGHNVFKGQTTN
jgi:hypothetical protein